MAEKGLLSLIVRNRLEKVFQDGEIPVKKAEYLDFLKKRDIVGRGLWEGSVKATLGSLLANRLEREIIKRGHYFYLEEIPRIGGHGYLVASELYDFFAANNNLRAFVSHTYGIFNLLICYLDIAYDKYTWAGDILSLQLNEELIEEVFSQRFAFKNVFSKEPHGEPLVQFILAMADHFRFLCYALYSMSNNHEAWESLKSQTRDAYRAEIRSLDAGVFAGEPDYGIEQCIRTKSIYPFVILSSLIQLSEKDAPTMPTRSIFEDIGNLFWIMDDLLDIEDDLDAKRWNYLLLKASSSWGYGQLLSMKSEEIKERLVHSALLNQCIEDLIKTYRSLENRIDSTGRNKSLILSKVPLWIYTWLNASAINYKK